MTYQETLAYIYGLGRFGMKPGLERVTTLLKALGNPQNRVQTVHVAGTNGKGSTAAFLSSILSAGGHEVGLFTSPHLTNFTERMRINGIEITEEEVIALGERVMASAPEGTTFFEMVTAMAFLHFAERGVALAVMEAGMGGRFDATNAASGILSVITPVSLDHCDFLGKTIAEIALEKAGVTKPGRPVVTSAQDAQALAVIERQSAEYGSTIYRYGVDFYASWERDGLAYRGVHTALAGLRPGINGSYQAANAAAALCAAELLDALGINLDAVALKNGIEKACWPGRMEMVSDSPRILLDGAHNPAGGLALVEALTDIPRERLFLVAGVMGDKDAEGILGPLVPLIDEAFAVSPALERALPSGRLAEFFRNGGIRCVDAGPVAAGLDRAKKMAGPADLILVCGSLFTVGEARAYLLARRFEPFRG
jgi:dihydrofolate synthase/folylpolyglutamate synthase